MTVTLNVTPTVVSTTNYVVVVANSSAQPGDWVAQYLKNEPDPNAILAWQYLSGTHTQPAAGIANATLSFPAMAGGPFEFRLLLQGSGLTPAVTVSADTPPPPPPPPPPGPGPGPTPGMPPVGAVLTADLDVTGKSDFVIRGVTFNGCGILASSTTRGLIVDCTFNDSPNRGLDGAAISVNGATHLTIANNAFNRVQGNGIGQYGWGDGCVIDGNWFTDCYGPITSTMNVDTTYTSLLIQRNVFLRYVRTCFEHIGPDTPPYVSGPGRSGLVIKNNQFLILNSVNPVQYGTGPVSCVDRGEDGRHYEGNYFYQGEVATWGPIASIEDDTQPGRVQATASGNIFVQPTGAYEDNEGQLVLKDGTDTFPAHTTVLPAPPARGVY